MPQPIDLVRAIRDDNAASLRNMASEAPRALRTFIAVDALEEVGGATSAVPGAAAAGPVAMDAETWLPLHFAAAWNRPELVAMLADDFGVSVDCRTRFRLPTRARQTPLILAATAGHERVVDALLQRHAEVEVRDARADGPLMLAAAAGHVGVIRRLLDAGAQLDAGDGQGRTPLHRAIRGPDAPPPRPPRRRTRRAARSHRRGAGPPRRRRGRELPLPPRPRGLHPPAPLRSGRPRSPPRGRSPARPRSRPRPPRPPPRPHPRRAAPTGATQKRISARTRQQRETHGRAPSLHRVTRSPDHLSAPLTPAPEATPEPTHLAHDDPFTGKNLRKELTRPRWKLCL